MQAAFEQSPYSTSDGSIWPSWAPCQLSSPVFYAEPQLGALLTAICLFAPLLTQPTTVTTWCQKPLHCAHSWWRPCLSCALRCWPPPTRETPSSATELAQGQTACCEGPGSMPGPWARARLQTMWRCASEHRRLASLIRALVLVCLPLRGMGWHVCGRPSWLNQ